MTTTLPASLLSAPLPGEVKLTGLKKKRVLLVDTSHAKRELRAEVMRKCGMDVDCAADITEARSWWKAALYDLVLINMHKGLGDRDKFCDDVRGSTPPQRLAFLVGQPEYLADSPNGHDDSLLLGGDRQILDDPKANGDSPRSDISQRWGILEASKRISAVRSTSIARTQAMRALPGPPRDSEGRPPKRTPTTTLDDLLREELR